MSIPRARAQAKKRALLSSERARLHAACTECERARIAPTSAAERPLMEQ